MDTGVFYQISRLIESERYGLAHEKITEVLTVFPNSPEAHLLRAETYLRENKYTEARQAASETIQINPESDDAFCILSHIEIAEDNYKEALELIERAMMLNPYEHSYFGVKSQIFLLKKDYKQAVAIAEEGLTLNPDDLTLNNLLSMAQSRMGQTTEAKERLEQMMGEDPENPLTQANMGFYYLQKGNSRKAKEHFAMALQQNPNHHYARIGMMEAMKASSFLYAKLLQFAFWMDRIGTQNRWLFIIGLLVVINVVPVLAPFYLIFILWTWFTAPLSNIILYFDKYGKYLMEPHTVRLTQINTGLLGASLLSVMLGVGFNGAFFVMAFACFLSIVPVFLIDSHKRQTSHLVLGGTAIAFVGIGAFGVYQGLLAGGSSLDQWQALMWGAMIFSWVVSVLD